LAAANDGAVALTITRVTRQALAQDLSDSPFWWGGDLDELVLLARLYDLEGMPSHDNRYRTAHEDIVQHCINNPDDWEVGWIFTDERFGLATDDEKLLTFLVETLNPEVRTNEQAVADLAELYNRHLRRDGMEIFVRSTISQRPVYGWRTYVAKTTSLLDLRSALAESIAEHQKAYEVAKFCDSVGLGAQGPNEDPGVSKRVYVNRHTAGMSLGQLIPIARRVAEDFGDDELLKLVDFAEPAAGGVSGVAKRLMFATTQKPELVFIDAINSDTEIVRNKDDFLDYRRPIGSAGLSWQDLVSWWSDDHPGGDNRFAANTLYQRLLSCLGTEDNPERLFLRVYKELYKSQGFHLPALLPQVYLQLDPRGRSDGTLAYQRVDFLLFMPNRHRVVLELDGAHHYSSKDGMPSPRNYAKMVREDRRIRLRGYELYRFGGAEMLPEALPEAMLRSFFRDLLRTHGINIDNGPPAPKV
jgi:AbiJ N-terminal domain 3